MIIAIVSTIPIFLIRKHSHTEGIDKSHISVKPPAKVTYSISNPSKLRQKEIEAMQLEDLESKMPDYIKAYDEFKKSL